MKALRLANHEIIVSEIELNENHGGLITSVQIVSLCPQL